MRRNFLESAPACRVWYRLATKYEIRNTKCFVFRISTLQPRIRNTKVFRISYIDSPTSYTKYKSVSYFVYRFSNLYTKYKSVSYFVFHFLTCRIQNTKYKSRGERQELARRGGGQTGSEYNSGGRARRADGRGADGARSQTGARGANTIVGGVRGAQTGGAQTGRALRRAL